MKIAVTGGTGFVGRHVVRLLAAEGHHVVVIARGMNPNPAPMGANVTWVHGSVTDPKLLESSLAGCEAVGHLAGIHYERPGQTFDEVHVQGTRNVVTAALNNGLAKVVLLSFLRACADSGSAYHESKWQAEQIVRESGLAFAIFKSNLIYGPGDHMLEDLSLELQAAPVSPLAGFSLGVRPVAVREAAAEIAASLAGDQHTGQTVALLGPTELALSDAIRNYGASSRTFRRSLLRALRSQMRQSIQGSRRDSAA